MRYVCFLLALCLLFGLLSHVNPLRAAGAEGGDSTASAGDSAEAAITILLPDLADKASSVDSTSGFKDLYRAVTVARGYLQLGLYEEASDWYERLAAVDREGLFADAVFHGRLSVAAGTNDLDQLNELIRNQNGAIEDPDLDLLYGVCQQIAGGGDYAQVISMIESTRDLFGEKPPANILLLEGRALRREGRLVESVYHFERLLNALKVPSSVHPSLVEQKARLIQSAADCSFLMNDRLRARQLYRELLKDEDPVYRAWGRFQLAQLDMLANDYEGAQHGFMQVSADSLDLRIEDWAQTLADHCRVMRNHERFYVDTSPKSLAAAP